MLRGDGESSRAADAKSRARDRPSINKKEPVLIDAERGRGIVEGCRR